MVEQEEIAIDTGLVRRIHRENGARWLGGALLATVILTVAGGLVIPQAYTATTTTVVQQSSGVSSPLALLGAGGSTKRYIGVIQSRWAAAQVARAVGIRQLYHLKSDDDAIDLLTKSVKAQDDATDGLLHVSVTLKGPSRLAPGAGARRDAVRAAAVSAANDYLAALREYYVEYDTNHDAVLIRGADDELRRARQEYNRAGRSLHDFLIRAKSRDLTSISVTDGGSTSVSTSELPRLYDELAQVESQISADEAGYSAEERMVQGQLGSISQVPLEDPLLSTDRQAVADDKSNLQFLQVQFGPDHPDVVKARAKLAIDQQRLSQHMSGIRGQKTTHQVAVEAQLQGLRAKQATLERQIAAEEARDQVGRRVSSEYLGLRTNWEIKLEQLKTTTEEAEKIRIQNVSAQSMMAVIDTAHAKQGGSPSLGLIAIASLFLSLIGLGVAYVREYIVRSSVSYEGRA